MEIILGVFQLHILKLTKMKIKNHYYWKIIITPLSMVCYVDQFRSFQQTMDIVTLEIVNEDVYRLRIILLECEGEYIEVE